MVARPPFDHCDGPRSRVRGLPGIPEPAFRGPTHPSTSDRTNDWNDSCQNE